MDQQPKSNDPDETRENSETMQEERLSIRTPQAIGLSEEWLYTTLQSIGDAVIATDAKGFIVYMNPVAVRLTRWSEEEAQGVACAEVFRIVNETTRKETESPVTKVLRDGMIAGLANHTILIARDGSEINIDDSGSPIHNAAGELIGIVLIFRDVTVKRKTEQTLEEQKNILQTLFDHIPVIVTFLDDNEQFKWINREWTKTLGWSLEEMQAPERRQTFLSSRWLEQKRGDLSLLTSPLAWRELAIQVKDGRRLNLSWTMVRLSDGTSIGIGQDITLRKIEEAAVERHIELVEAKNTRLRQAMQETDHRVKNNLQSISALLDIQIMENAQAIPVEELAQVRMHINTLASLHDMLTRDVTSEGAAGSLSTQEALQKILPMLQELVGKTRLKWTVQNVQFPVKQGMSLAVLVNELVTNAVKHGSRQVDLQFAVVENRVTLEVCDDGPGFPETFNPRTAANFGLELVESIGRLDLGGQTTYENRPEGGACVRVVFPMPALMQA